MSLTKAKVNNMCNLHLRLAWWHPHEIALGKSSNRWSSCSLECLNLKITAKILRKCSAYDSWLYDYGVRVCVVAKWNTISSYSWVTIHFGYVITAFARFKHSKEDGPKQYEDSPHETAWWGSHTKHRCWFYMLFSSVSDIGHKSVVLKNY